LFSGTALTQFLSPPAAAERALEQLNYTKINEKPIRLMWSHRDPNTRKNNAANIFIKVRAPRDATLARPDATPRRIAARAAPAGCLPPRRRVAAAGCAPRSGGLTRDATEPGRDHQHQGAARHV
jgi:hypothetical protein